MLEKKEEGKCCEHSVNGLDLFNDSKYFLDKVFPLHTHVTYSHTPCHEKSHQEKEK